MIRSWLCSFVACAALLSAVAAPALDVYVMPSGNMVSDQAVVDALTNRGHVATLGADVCAWDGSQANLSGFDVVVLLNSQNWNACSPGIGEKGADAVKDFVSAGGGLVTGEWLVWNIDSGGRHGLLEPIIPADLGTYALIATTTYRQVTADPILNDSLPVSFEFPLNNYSGSDSFFTPKGDATLFYDSHLAGNIGGVVGWGYDAGRVVSFSTFISSVELSDSNYERLFVNAVEWAGAGPLDNVRSIAGKKLLIKDKGVGKRKIVFIAKDERINAASGGIDPLNDGAHLLIYNSEGGSEAACIALPSVNWSANGGGFKYQDSEFSSGPCKVAKVTDGKLLKVVCLSKAQPINYALDAVPETGVTVRLQSGNITYCARFAAAGTDEEGKFLAKDADAPNGCPPAPIACP